MSSKQESAPQNNLRGTRVRLGLSQQQVADAAGIARQTVGGIESGQYSASAAVALRLARALGCRVEDLFWLDEDLPQIEAVRAAGLSENRDSRVTLARVGDRWVAHSLEGARAFRTEMVPADGTCAGRSSSGSVTVQLLDEPENLARTVVIAGCTPALSLWARSAERWHPGLRVHWIHANSTDALESLARGEVHAAGVHLIDAETGEFNVPSVRRVVSGSGVILVNLGTWEEGLAVRTGNPLGLCSAADLGKPGVRIVNREEGAGSRVLLDSLLREEGIDGASLAGYERTVAGHEEVARCVFDGQADTGISTAAAAAQYRLDFVPLRSVRFDLAVKREYLGFEPVRQLLGTLHHRWIRSQLKVLGGFDTTLTGETVAEVEAGS
jgi:putative molybdopterin biosynthesis protein